MKELGLLERLVVATEKIAAKLGTASLPLPMPEKPEVKPPKKDDKKVIVIDKTEGKKEKPKPKPKKDDKPGRTEATRFCKDYRKYFGEDALMELWASQDGAESLNDIKDFEELISLIVDAFQKEIIRLGKRVSDVKKINAIKKDFEVEKLVHAKQDYPGVLAAIKEALPKKKEETEDEEI